MDPITAVGAVASIITLAQTALTLSTTLYGLGSALLSAFGDLRSLADDLKTFSQSLTLLSRLLEDSKSWYSDDIYLLTAKVIKDCADLYSKIDGVLSKLGGKGKASWMKRMKYMLKESQIRRLLSRLRDLKSTLATILMSLQVDLQLSLLKITSSSKLQRAPEVPLQPGTVETLREAQEAVRRSRLPSVQAAMSDGIVQVYVEELSHEFRSDEEINYPVALQEQQESMLMFQQATNVANRTDISRSIASPPRSLKSSCSLDSFKSAIEEQESDVEVIREVEGILYGFQTALEVLEKVMKRIDKGDKVLKIEAEKLNYSLTKGVSINHAHGSHHHRHGKAYLSALRDSQMTLRQLQDIVTNLMGELVTTLHMYSAAYEVLSPAGFQKLYSCSEKCRIRTLFELDRLAMLLFPQPVRLVFVNSDFISPLESVSLQKSEHTVQVTEVDIDQRLSADYGYLLSGHRRLMTLPDSALPFYRPQQVSNAAGGGGISPESSWDEVLFGLTWDSRTPTPALPDMNDIATPTANHPYPTIGDFQYQQVKQPPLSRSLKRCRRACKSIWNDEPETPTPATPVHPQSFGTTNGQNDLVPVPVRRPPLVVVPKSLKIPGAFDDDLVSTTYPIAAHEQDTVQSALDINFGHTNMFDSMNFANPATGTADVLQDSYFDDQFFSEDYEDLSTANKSRTKGSSKVEGVAPAEQNCNISIEPWIKRGNQVPRAPRDSDTLPLHARNQQPQPQILPSHRAWPCMLTNPSGYQAKRINTSILHHKASNSHRKHHFTQVHGFEGERMMARRYVIEDDDGSRLSPPLNPTFDVFLGSADGTELKMEDSQRPRHQNARSDSPSRCETRQQKARENYYEQLLLLEQQNQKRLSRARMEMKPSTSREPVQAPIEGLYTYSYSINSLNSSFIGDSALPSLAQDSLHEDEHPDSSDMSGNPARTKIFAIACAASAAGAVARSAVNAPTTTGVSDYSQDDEYSKADRVRNRRRYTNGERNSRLMSLPLEAMNDSEASPRKRRRTNDRRGGQEKLMIIKENKGLWRLAYMSLEETHPGDVEFLKSAANSELSLDLGQELNATPAWGATVMYRLLMFSKDDNTDPSLADANSHRRNIARVINAVYESLGLANSDPVWLCVAILLKIYHPVLSPTTTDPPKLLSPQHVAAMTETLSQLNDLVSMVARYSVMENLYYQNPTMTLKADYKAALLGLCCKILQWFVAAFKISIEEFLVQSELNSTIANNTTNTVFGEIKAMDKSCQKFTVIVEPREEDNNEGENNSAKTPLSEFDIEDTYGEDTMDFTAWLGKEEDEKLEAKLRKARGRDLRAFSS